MSFGIISFQIISFIYVLLTLGIFLLKKKVKNYDVKLYTWLLVVCLASLFFDVFSIYTIYHKEELGELFNNIICKTYLVCLITWIELITEYVYITIVTIKRKDSSIWTFLIILIINAIIVFALPIESYVTEYSVYTRSWAVYFVYFIYACCSIVLIAMVSFLYAKYTKDERQGISKKLIPIGSIIVITVTVAIVQYNFPQLLLASPAMALVTVIMFHTIENPDIAIMKQLDEARKTAEDANLAKTEFLSSMSHEIRTPLNAIIGFSEFIDDSESLDDAKSYSRDIVSASQSLLETVNGILDISKVESGKYEIVETDYNLKDFFDSTVKLTQARLTDKQIDFIYKLQDDLPMSLHGDRSSLNKIVINLLTNAVKYTKTGSITYTINGTKEADICKLVISVADTGMGIKADDIGKLFSRFQRLDEKKNSSIEGTGLGLAITKELVELMGGNIVVSSEYGKGSIFTVSIDQKISTTYVEEGIVITKETEYDFSDKKILVVDDNNLNLKLATRLFGKYHCQVITVNSGFECIDLIEKGNKYDIIFLDDVMPKMLGSETLSRLKRIEGFNIPVVALTANAIEGTRDKYLSLGFDDYVTKPIDRAFLESVLVNYFVKNKKVVDLNNSAFASSRPVELISNNVKKSILNSPSAKDVIVKNESGDTMDDKNVVGIQTNVTDKAVEVSLPTNEVYTDYSDKRILVVDDNKLNLKVALKFLSRYNFQADEAYSGEECLNKVKSGVHYDIIFMDIMMPNMNGVETFHALQGIDGFNTPVVVALTADAVEGAKERYLSEGFAEYISKPIVREKLDSVIHSILD